MIEQKIKEYLEKYFSNISNWETKKIYFGNNYQLQLIKFDFNSFWSSISLLKNEIKEICNKYSTYYIEPEIKMSNKTISIKFRYFIID